MSINTSEYRGLRDALRAIIPIWLQDRPGLRTGYQILYTATVIVDIAITWLVQAVYSWFPGYSLGAPGLAIDPSSGLPLIGRSRGILRGEADTDVSYAARLVRWLDDWEAAGSSEILAAQIHAYLGNAPMVRIVDRAGNWVTIDSAGNITKTSAPWNWDGDDFTRAGWWSDLWIIVYPCEWPITGTSLASLIGVWGNESAATEVGTGHAVPRTPVDAILGLVATWKGAHCWCEAIVWSYDATLFVPGSPVAGDPDGGWAHWSKNVAGTQVVARYGSTNGKVRYWIPAGG